MDDIYSNIAIDLGGKHTGFISYTAKGMPEPEDINAAIIEMPDQGNGMNYTVKDRTAVRHHIRAEDRFKKARKLMYTVIEYKIKRLMTNKEKEAISTLLRRRGYTRLEAEVNLDVLKDCSQEFFAQIQDKNNPFNLEDPLYEQFTQKCCDIPSVEKFKRFLQGSIKEEIEKKETSKVYKSAYDEMNNAVEDLLNQDKMGHKPRKVYLENIRKDLAHDSRLKNIVLAFGSSDALYRCVGNISNFQLRALRWYFNDITMKGNPRWENERFQKNWIRALQFFHYPDQNDREKAGTIIKTIRESKDCIKTLTEIDPVDTIPPYEDQNNRRPPVDQTLLLSPKALDNKYGDKWEKWTESFITLFPRLEEDLDRITRITDRKSRIEWKNDPSYTIEKIKHSYAMQRLFDLTYNEDLELSKLRRWSINPISNQLKQIDNLIIKITKNDYDDFLTLTHNYYYEVGLAKEGLWSVVKNPLMEISGIHPPLKNRMIGELVAGVLNIHEHFDYDKFKEIWNSKVIGRSTVRSICKSIEELRKTYGNEFKFEVDSVVNKIKRDPKQKINKEEKSLYAIKSQTETVSQFIGKKLNLSQNNITKFSNPFSLSQLYTLIETDTLGFSSTCQAVCAENNFRMQSSLGQKAMCSRLPAESVRPFDGSLGKILKRQAYEIAKRKVNELKELSGIRNSRIHLGILIEENKFQFTASIAEIKKSAKLKKIESRTGKGIDKENKRYENKYERIKKASKGICPYTGDTIVEGKGEIDHIIPRSLTKESMGTIFNSEANLIYTSQKGNQYKKNNEYRLEDLNSKYLVALFGTNVISDIKNIIENTVKEVQKKNSQLLFDLMTDDEMKCCRHALFMPGSKAYEIVKNAMAKQYSTRVNGTQSWFIKEIIESIQYQLDSWLKDNNNTIDFSASKIDVLNMSRPFRDALAQIDPIFEKKEPQPITSHAIDALCVLAGAASDKKIASKISNEEELAPLTDPKYLLKLVPRNYEIVRINNKDFALKNEPESRKLFKDTIYGEHFLPVMVMNGKQVKIGFNWGENSIEITEGQDKFLQLLAKFFTEKINVCDKFHSYRIDKNKAFTHLHRTYSSSDSKNAVFEDQATLLNALYYTTSSYDVYSVLLHGNKIQTRDELNKEIKKFSKIKISPDKLPNGIKFSKPNSYLYLPSISDWKKIINKMNNYLGQELEKDVDAIQFINKQLKDNINHKSKNIAHKATKRVYSLPGLDGPSSSGVRIQRRDRDGNDVYQLYDINTPNTVMKKGFALENGIVNWGKSVDVDAYIGKNLTLAKDHASISSDFIEMDQTRCLFSEVNESNPLNNRLIIKMSPGTEGRRIIFIEQSFKDFQKWFSNIIKDLNTPLEIKTSYILEENDIDQFVQNLPKGYEVKPRIDKKKAKIFVTYIGDIVKYYYKSSSGCTKDMKKAFDQAN